MLEYNGKKKEVSGGDPATTNNRMELQAAIGALSALREPCEVELFTDSNYLRDGITKWISSWKKRGWITSTKEPVKNEDLWRALDAATRPHRITWRWLRGHAGHEGNERCDQLAGMEMAKIRKQFTREQLRAKLDEFASGKKRPSPQLGLFGAAPSASSTPS